METTIVFCLFSWYSLVVLKGACLASMKSKPWHATMTQESTFRKRVTIPYMLSCIKGQPLSSWVLTCSNLHQWKHQCRFYVHFFATITTITRYKMIFLSHIQQNFYDIALLATSNNNKILNFIFFQNVFNKRLEDAWVRV